METIFIILVLWVLASLVFAELIPVLFELLGYAIAFLFKCIFAALFLILRGLWIGLLWAGRNAARGIALGALFVSILVQEWRRGGDHDAETDEEFEDGDAAGDRYEAARELLGLAPGFTRKAFERAYKAAMKRAHPDVGGNTAQAQEINQARDLIRRVHGWA